MSNRRGSRDREPTPLFSEQSERAIIGISLNDSAVFWDCYQKLKPQHFATPRLARIWDAMCRQAEAGKPVKANWIPMMIKNDSGEDTPLRIFLAAITNDAPAASEADAYVDTIIHLANKRALLDALDRAKSEILKLDESTPVEHMVDTGISMVTTSVDMDFDKDLRSYSDWARSLEKSAQENVEKGEDGGVGLSTGFSAVEEVIGRLLPGKVYVLAGMASGGKSALARQIAEAAAKDAFQRDLGYGYIASMEMTGEEYAARYMSEMLGIAGHRIEEGNLNRAEIEAIGRQVANLKRLPIMIDTRPRMNMENIRSRMMRVKNKNGLSFGVLDHLLLIRGSSKNDGMMDRVAEATIETKNIAKEFGIPIILLAQLNEKAIMESQSKWPNASHLFGGQAIQQNTDVTFFIHRPEIVLARTEPAKTQSKDGDKKSAWDTWFDRMENSKGKAYVWNNKRRGGEGNTKRELSFDGPTMSFRDYG